MTNPDDHHERRLLWDAEARDWLRALFADDPETAETSQPLKDLLARQIEHRPN